MTPVLLLAMLYVDPAPQLPREPRPYHAIQSDIRTAFRKQVAASGTRDEIEEVRRIVQLFHELQFDPRLASSPTLTGYRNRVWARLVRIRDQLNKQMAYEQRRRKDPQRSSASQSGGRGGRAVSDYGPMLVALIERTISPEFWDTNGGPGTIFYYRPMRVLVVRATTDVHDRIGGTLEDAR